MEVALGQRQILILISQGNKSSEFRLVRLTDSGILKSRYKRMRYLHAQNK